MSRARPLNDDWQTAAESEDSSPSGCLHLFILPPLAVLLVGILLGIMAFDLSPQTDSAPISNPPSASISAVFTPEVQFWTGPILRWSAAAGLDPNLAATIMQIESCGDPLARSSAGASGLFQVMPFHFANGEDPFQPDTNAARGLDYMKRSLAAAGNNVRLGLAGYNGGIGVISTSEWFWPAETTRYAYWGSGIYQDAASGKTQSPRLNEWLNAGGSGLCARAKQRLGITQ